MWLVANNLLLLLIMTYESAHLVNNAIYTDVRCRQATNRSARNKTFHK